MTANGRASVYALVEKGARDLLIPNRWYMFALEKRSRTWNFLARDCW
jgi:hypothetical protein